VSFAQRCDQVIPAIAKRVLELLVSTVGQRTGFVLVVFEVGCGGAARIVSNAPPEEIESALHCAARDFDATRGVFVDRVH
jgi:hypothetical protein